MHTIRGVLRHQLQIRKVATLLVLGEALAVESIDVDIVATTTITNTLTVATCLIQYIHRQRA
jgi:hypothetical protein